MPERRGRADAAAARRARRRAVAATACAWSATTGRGPRTSSRRRCCAPGGTATCSTSPPPAVRAWLFTVARNIVIDEWRSRRVPPRDPRRRRARSTRDRTTRTDQLLLSWVVAEALTQLSAGPPRRAARVLLPGPPRGRGGPAPRGARGHGEVPHALRAAGAAAGAGGDGGERMSLRVRPRRRRLRPRAPSPRPSAWRSSGTCAGCEDCTRAVRELAGLPGLLAASTPASSSTRRPTSRCPDTLLPALPARCAAARRRRTLVAAGLAAAVAAVVVGVPALLAGGDDGRRRRRRCAPSPTADRAPAVPDEPMSPVGDVPVRGDRRASSRSPGAPGCVLTCTYDPESVEYELPPDGRLHARRADPRRAHRAGRQLALGRRHDDAAPAATVRGPRRHRVSGGAHGRRTRGPATARVSRSGLSSQQEQAAASRSRPPRTRRPSTPPSPPALLDPEQPDRRRDDEGRRAWRGRSRPPGTAGTQCRQATSSTAITAPPTALSRKAGPTTSASRIPSNHRYEVHPRRHQHRRRRQHTHDHHTLPSRGIRHGAHGGSSLGGTRGPPRRFISRRASPRRPRTCGPGPAQPVAPEPVRVRAGRRRSGHRPRRRSPTRPAPSAPTSASATRWCARVRSCIQRTPSPRRRAGRASSGQRDRPHRVGVGHRLAAPSRSAARPPPR